MTDNLDHVRRRWDAIARLAAAHAMLLEGAEVIDRPAAAALARAIESAATGESEPGPLLAQVLAFDARVDALLPAGVVGALRLGRGSAETVATVARIVTRDQLLALADALSHYRRLLVDLAGAHVVTLAPAHHGVQAVLPTTFGHLLGGVIGPLERAQDDLLSAIRVVNESPLGAGGLAGVTVGPTREDAAAALGFEAPVANTFDAVAATDWATRAAGATVGAARPVARQVLEMARWLRDEPSSFLFREGWTARPPDLPHAALPVRFEALLGIGPAVEGDAVTIASMVAGVPLGAWTSVDGALAAFDRMQGQVTTLLAEMTDLLANGVEVNRALFANRASRGYLTGGDLAEFLMIEESLPPGAAAQVAALALQRVREEGLELSGLSSQMIDGASLLVIGRELGVEFESISRYLAPRRFIERRAGSGSAAPMKTREWLADAGGRIEASGAALGAERERVDAAAGRVATWLRDAAVEID